MALLHLSVQLRLSLNANQNTHVELIELQLKEHVS